MINICLKDGNKMITGISPESFREIPIEDILWIDLKSPVDKEKILIEETLGVRLLNTDEIEEIESTSKYYETPQGVVTNLSFNLAKEEGFEAQPTSFIITNDDRLISLHQSDLPSFDETERKMELQTETTYSGSALLMTILEVRIDKDADLIEMLSRQIAKMSKEILGSDSIEKSSLQKISNLQDKIMTLRENISDLQRVLFDIRRSVRFSDEIRPRLQLMLKDVDSLINHADFSFQRLDTLQNTALGLINIEQNEIVKILSVAAVIFMPPTLVASIYGMNFKFMPELNWGWQMSNGWIFPTGYFFALFLMISLAFATLWFFKHKKWL